MGESLSLTLCSVKKPKGLSRSQAAASPPPQPGTFRTSAPARA